MKLQIALEYMVIFAFVILLFSVIFVTIANQRASVLNDQLNSHIQLIAQDIASRMDIAAQSGNGYTSTFQLPESGTIQYYSLNVTRNGEVIVSSSISKQTLTAVAFSLAGSVTSNPSFESTNSPNTFSIPVSNGTISITNLNGGLCVDYACPSLSNVSESLSVSAQPYHSAWFNGNHGNINTSTTYPSNSVNENFSVSAWVYTTGQCSTSVYCGIVDSENGVEGWGLTASQTIADFWIYQSVSGTTADMEFAIPNRQWTNIVVTYGASGSNYLANAYVNGKLVDANVLRSPVTLPLPHALQIGIGKNSNSRVFNGSIANVQVYNSSLSYSQALALYDSGIDGAPVSNSVIAWYPLNGNANDYSGVSGPGSAVGYVPFGTVAQIYAKAMNENGLPMNNTLVGFTSSMGNLSAKGRFYSAYTNTSGIATAFLTQGQSDGYSGVTATAFNGNLSTQRYLKLWLPADTGYGSNVFDVSGYNGTGAISNASWSRPSSATFFNGHNSYINVPNSTSMNVSYITMSAWVYLTSYSCGSDRGIIANKENSYEFGVMCNSGYLSSAISPNWAWYNSPDKVPLDKWTFVAVSWDGTHERQYINGALVYNATPPTTGVMVSTSQCFRIGARNGCGAPESFFNGSISNVQVYKNALSSNQLFTLYQEGLGAVPVSPGNVVAWYPLAGDAIDYSGHGNNGTAFNVYTSPLPQSLQEQQGVTPIRAAQLTGSLSKITLPNNTALQPSGFVAVSMWVNASPIQSGVPAFFSETPSSDNYGYSLFPHSGYLNFTVKDGSSAWGSCSAQGSQNIEDGSRHLVAGIYNGSSISVYVDGQLEARKSCPNKGINYSTNSTGTIALSFNGIAGNVQVYSGGITGQSITSEYQSGPTSFPQNQASLSGWWPLDGSANDYSAYGDNGTLYTTSFVQANLSSSALTNAASDTFGLNFNGQNSYASIPTSNALTSNNFTLDAWVKWDGIRYSSSSGEDWAAIISKGYFNGGEYTVLLHRVSGATDTTVNLYINGVLAVSWPNSVANTQWNMLTFTYNGKVASIFYDGINETHASYVSSVTADSLPFTVGSQTSGYYWGGGIANVQMYNSSLSGAQVLQLYRSQMPPTKSVFVPLSWLP